MEGRRRWRVEHEEEVEGCRRWRVDRKRGDVEGRRRWQGDRSSRGITRKKKQSGHTVFTFKILFLEDTGETVISNPD